MFTYIAIQNQEQKNLKQKNIFNFLQWNYFIYE